jgi:hypothetical protein
VETKNLSFKIAVRPVSVWKVPSMIIITPAKTTKPQPLVVASRPIVGPCSAIG